MIIILRMRVYCRKHSLCIFADTVLSEYITFCIKQCRYTFIPFKIGIKVYSVRSVNSYTVYTWNRFVL